MKLSKLIALLLAILTLALGCISCSNETGDTEITTAGAQASEEATDPEDTIPPEEVFEIPDDHNLNREINIYSWSQQTIWEWDAESETGEVINDAIFRRLQKTEQLLGITIVVDKQSGDWENRNSFISKLEGNVKSNTHAYDFVGQYTPAAGIGAIKSLYMDLKDIDTIRLDKEWWPGDITETASINNRLYFITGDISSTCIRNMSTVMANLDLTNSYQCGNLFELVDNKQWTLDKMVELGTGKVSLNGGSDPTDYGITVTSNVTYDGLFYSGGFTFVEEDADGTLKMSADLAGEDLINWFDKCQKMLFNHDDVELKGIEEFFSAGHGLFHLGQTSDIQNVLRDVPFKFAVLPFPTFKEGQDYRTITGYWVTMFSVPTDAKNPEESGIALETLGYYGFDLITPAVYIDSFQYKYLDDPDNARMFRLLHDTMTYDTGRFFADAINCFAGFRQACTQDVSWSSYYETKKIAWNKGVKNVYEVLG